MALMSWRGLAAVGVTVAGAAGAAAAAKVASDRGRTKRRARRGDAATFGSLHSTPIRVMADDGVSLNVEVDEADDEAQDGAPTVVFVHGWVLDLNCWHYQRAALRGRNRLVLYDQRSHGKSGRSDRQHATLEQLGHDLRAVLDAVAPTGPVVLVGHSMGGMSVMAFAKQYPDVVRARVAGVVLMGTSAGELVGGGGLLSRTQPVLVNGLSKLTFLVDQARKVNSYALTKRFAVGPHTPEKYADMTDEMISAAPTHLFWDFYPNFTSLDLFDALGVLSGETTVVIGATKDQLTVYKHSRRLAEEIEGAELVTIEGAGHMMMLEGHDQVNEALIKLVDRVT
ncbi:alpha/beta fold hydrolase [Solicola sp. PLA-1-18]|uniref:alpha/beta fold hydrolase n=1 Tax=Solicola sp. PLA-1-18 TaxID=3380532 RepID=UPI003B8157AC